MAGNRPVVVIMGGVSPEHQVSLLSGAAVMRALESAGLQTASVVIDRDGCWDSGSGPMTESQGMDAWPDRAVGFLALHGGEGENGDLQARLEDAGIDYTGSGPSASRRAFDKESARKAATGLGLRVAEGLVVDRAAWTVSRDEVVAHVRKECLGAVFVKPVCSGSSVGVTLATNEKAISAAIDTALAEGDRVLVEAAVEGVEVSCGVLEGEPGQPRALMPVEIRPRRGGFFTTEEKYRTDGAVELCPPESLAPRVVEEVRRLALAVHAGMELRGMSRADFIVGPEGPVFLEVNTIPGLTDRSLLPQSAAGVGIPFERLLLSILEAAGG